MTSTVMHRAKRPLTKLAGPYGHPFHPALVTLPIGAFALSFAADIASRLATDPGAFGDAAYWLIGAGIVTALAAAMFGLLDLLAIPRGTTAFATGITHMVLNLIVVALFATSFLLRRGDVGVAGVDTSALVLSAVALALLGVSGYLGGKLAYRFGVRVAEETDQAEAFAPPAAHAKR
jgi:uncharacterized membrane protein